MGYPQFRWEFNLTLSGWGSTKEEAWESTLESMMQDGIHIEDLEEVLDPKEADEFRRKGRDHAFRGEADTSGCPAGAMLVWK